MQKIFSSPKSFWNWIAMSSANANDVALTVKGFFSMAVVQALFAVLPFFGVHPTFTLDIVGADASTIVYTALTVIAGCISTWGVIMKLYRTITGKNAAVNAGRI